MPSSMENVLAVILGGGRGSRLFPLTGVRSKPAVPMAGKYRLIDIPISNCINSGIYRIAVLTQFNSVSLHRHIAETYHFDAFHTGWVQIWAAEQTMATVDWYQGTADAVRKQLYEIRSTRAGHVLILAGDHLYRMDFEKMAAFHMEHNADITVAVQPVRASEASRFGLLKVNPDMSISRFAEKPTDPPVLEDLKSRSDPERPYLGSMGIYLFKADVLHDMLRGSKFDDFGGQVIPAAIETHSVKGYNFDGYWEDIGTIRSFYETNLALAMPNPPFDFFDPQRPIYTHSRFLPGSTAENSRLENVLLADGCCIRSAEIIHAVIGIRSQIQENVFIKDTIMMGADYYDNPCQEDEERISIGIGSHSSIEGAIIDKNARIGHHTVIKPFPADFPEYNGENFVVREGVVVIPKSTTLPPHTYIAPDMKEIQESMGRG
ncbi:MAG TPA: glucose-1-phosphate adenylyltransferase [Anaerolineaceae bacterium]